MNVLPFDRQVAVVAALTEGCSIRAIERLTGIHRDTIMRLGRDVGVGCAKLHNAVMRELHVGRVELDETWSYVGKKRDHVKPGDPAEFGDQYVFVALDSTSKGIISYRVGKRDGENTRRFVDDLKSRLDNNPEISSDGFPAYPYAVESAFGWQIDYGTIEKNYAVASTTPEAARRYSPAEVVSVTRRVVLGAPQHISTSYVERQNLTLRMQTKRFARLSNGFSKKLENHMAAVALYVCWYNLCHVNSALRITAAMHLGVADHVWTIAELVEAALTGAIPEPAGKRHGGLRVIDGGRS